MWAPVDADALAQEVRCCLRRHARNHLEPLHHNAWGPFNAAAPRLPTPHLSSCTRMWGGPCAPWPGSARAWQPVGQHAAALLPACVSWHWVYSPSAGCHHLLGLTHGPWAGKAGRAGGRSQRWCVCVLAQGGQLVLRRQHSPLQRPIAHGSVISNTNLVINTCRHRLLLKLPLLHSAVTLPPCTCSAPSA